ncbi:MAG: hypothetical protein KatS3mg044_0310 [Rhodothermaceae bacterium]|nr:MAG: hypothetical protein KatS3mg044_0310 [Rhodothermaceae bacterium]
MKKILSIAPWMMLVAGLALQAPAAEAQQRVVLMEESRLWIEGQTNVNRFACEAKTFTGEGVLAGELPMTASSATGALRRSYRHVARLVVPVREFDCGKDRMNADLYRALKAEDYPEIVFELDAASVAAAEDHRYGLVVDGRLRIAGVENAITLTVQAERRADGRYRATGGYPLRMSDYGIDPPRALLGLIRVDDQIVVHFDLVAAPVDSLTHHESR